MKFNVRSLAALKIPDVAQVDYFDVATPGFGLRVSPGGTRTWFVMYRADARKRRLKVGTLPRMALSDARTKALGLLRLVEDGRDPAAEKVAAKAAETVDELIERYVEKYAKPRKKSWLKDQQALAREVSPKLGSRKAASIVRRDIREILDEIAARAPVRANRVLEIVRRMFAWAVSQEIVATNPCTGLEKPSGENSRDRVLSEDELRRLWAAIEGDPDPRARACFKLYFLTAAREMEVLAMRWPDLDLERAVWELPGESVKNGIAHRLPLPPAAVALLRGLESTRNGPFVFAQADGRKPVARCFVERRIIKYRAASGVEDIRIHDFRRSVATFLTGMGVSRVVLKQILNHVDSDVTATYDRFRYDAEKRAALEAWERRIGALVANEPASSSNIVELPRRA